MSEKNQKKNQRTTETDKKNHHRLRTVIIVLVVLIIIMAAASGGSDNSTNSTNSETSQTNSETSQTDSVETEAAITEKETAITEKDTRSQTENVETDTKVVETDTETVETETTAETESETLTLDDLTPEMVNFKNGEIQTINVNDDEVIIKSKIKSALTNKMTVQQNYYDVCDFIRDYYDLGFKTVSYWAVADMSDGSEQKVISFDVPENVVETIATQDFPDNQLGDYVTDLWIHQSLRND